MSGGPSPGVSPDLLKGAIGQAMHLGQAHFTSQGLYCIALHDIPTLIGQAGRPLSVEEILMRAKGSSMQNSNVLLRVMRQQASVGVFKETSNDGVPVFGLTDVSNVLRTDVSGQPSLRCALLHWLDRCLWRSWDQLPQALEQEDGAEVDCFTAANSGVPMSEFTKQSPQFAQSLNDLVSLSAEQEATFLITAFADQWQLLEIRSAAVVDVGGNDGSTMGLLKKWYPGLKLSCLDLPEVIAAAAEAPEGVAMVAGNMFEPDTIPRCDCIVLKHVLHSWSDLKCVAILKSCAEALPLGGRVVICDAVLPRAGEGNPSDTPRFGMDMFMLLSGGRERTRDDWAEVLEASGYNVEKVAVFQNAPPLASLIVAEKM